MVVKSLGPECIAMILFLNDLEGGDYVYNYFLFSMERSPIIKFVIRQTKNRLYAN